MTEREADAFSINTAREPDGMAKVALKLGDLSQVGSNAAGRIHLLRSSQRSRPHPDGDGLEGGAFALRAVTQIPEPIFLTADYADG